MGKMNLPKAFDSRYVWVSPSQLDKFLGCKRQWAAKYIHKLPEPTTTAQAFGTAVHVEIENYFRHGTPPTKHRAKVLSMLKLLPSPALGPLAEKELILEVIPNTVYMVGYKDLELPPRRILDHWPGVVIFDHKTTSAPQWAKTKEDLEGGDLQAVCYTIEAERKYPQVDPEDIQVQWTYILSKGKAPPWRVCTTVPIDVRKQVWEDKVVKSAHEIVKLRKDSAALEKVSAAYDSEACTKFGGCPHRDTCALIREKEDNMSRAEWLAKMKAAKAQVTTPDLEGPTPAAVEEPINPPEKVLSVPVEEPAAAEPAPAKRRGRPKKDAAPREETAPEPREEKAPAPQEEKAPAPEPSTPQLHVYVNCYPIKGAVGPVMLLHDLAERAARAVEMEEDIPHWSLLEYGRGVGALVAEFSKQAPASGTVLVDQYTAEGKALLPWLEQHASLVVRG